MKDKPLKTGLIFISFAPLSLLLLIKNFNIDSYKYVIYICMDMFRGGNRCLSTCAMPIIDTLIMLICSISLIIAIVFYFKVMRGQKYGFCEDKDIENISYNTELSMDFFVAYIIPLVIKIDSVRDFIVIVLIVRFLERLINNTDYYYCNPILTLLKYNTFSFNFKDEKNVKSIGITYGRLKPEIPMKYKKICENVYFIYNIKIQKTKKQRFSFKD